ncbi:hypothetical protein BZA05DRAFT_245548 [Tricharina praecox]|uniref:uncharacterized protein n=1 Tax=Tricharina praecox TaxID=43433 RepID=UPI002220E5F4|nr:uncharacterized protein BZA05DRAFT_245548 [Tricharina praecox]KAI5854591.1 hypothetical protein BZA05DRAFT_245548 [Tricharina praecox]
MHSTSEAGIRAPLPFFHFLFFFVSFFSSYPTHSSCGHFIHGGRGFYLPFMVWFGFLCALAFCFPLFFWYQCRGLHMDGWMAADWSFCFTVT